MYEIIVVTNFKVDVRNFPNDINITVIMMNGIIGEQLYAGVSAAKYEIVAFLDDDDTFEQEKLQRLVEVFSGNSELCYYHNDLKYVNSIMHPIDYMRMVEKKSQLLNEKSLIVDAKSNLNLIKMALEKRGDFNLSSIAIRRECSKEYMSLLKQIKGLTDGFFFWASLITMGQLMIDNIKLTNYRVHQSNISAQIDFTTKAGVLKEQIYTYDLILNFMKETNYQSKNIQSLRRWIFLCIYEYELMCLVFADSSRVSIIKQIKKLLIIGIRYSNTLKYRVLLFAIFGIIDVKLAQKLYLGIRSARD